VTGRRHGTRANYVAGKSRAWIARRIGAEHGHLVLGQRYVRRATADAIAALAVEVLGTPAATPGFATHAVAGDQAWMEMGACRHGRVPVEAFFPGVDHVPPHLQELCERCPVRLPCLDFALTNDEQGIWGGTSERQRRSIRRRRRQGAA
jgi:WhiB family transcriptional regulator, redox-sensing transcriptional regulator